MKKNIFFINAYGCPAVSGDLSKMFELLKEKGISGLQIAYDELLMLDKEEFKRLLGENDVEVLCTHVVSRLCARDDEIFCGAVNLCKEALCDISHLGCKYIMPVPFYPSDIDGFSDKQRALKRYAEALGIIIQDAKKYGIKVIIENISRNLLPFSTIEDVEFLVNNVQGLEFCFDTGNFFCTNTNELEAFERLKDKINMVHVKDFGLCENDGYECEDGKRVCHVDFGKGEVGLCEVMKRLAEYKPDVPYVIEVHSESPEKTAIDQAIDFFDGIGKE